MTKTIQIDPPKGYKFQSVDDATGAINMVEIPVDIRERIQSVDDIFALNNTTKEAFEAKWHGFLDHEKGDALEKLMVAAYNNNDGKLPDFTDDNYKYYPRFKMGSSSGVGFSFYVFAYWSTTSAVGARLVFYGENAYENMLDATTKFIEIYKQSRTK